MAEDNKEETVEQTKVEEQKVTAPETASTAEEAQTPDVPVEAAQNIDPENFEIPDYLQDLPVRVDVMLGSVKLSVRDLIKCGPGSVIDVGKKISDLFDLYINNTLVARGEVVTMHDRLGLKVVEVVDKPPVNS